MMLIPRKSAMVWTTITGPGGFGEPEANKRQHDSGHGWRKRMFSAQSIMIVLVDGENKAAMVVGGDDQLLVHLRVVEIG